MAKLNKILIIVLGFLAQLEGYGQHFAYASKCGNIPSDGFYSIKLTPVLSSYVDVSLKDLRIINSKGEQIPYIIKTSLPELRNDDFDSLKIIDNTIKDSGRTHLILDNIQKANISEIAFLVRNASVSRTARLSGSDDGIKWFAIAEDFELRGGYNSDRDHFVLNINFPVSSYRYLKFVINNFKNDPLNIVEARYKVMVPWKRFNFLSDNPSPVFSQVDSTDGYSYIKVTQPKAYHINEIRLNIERPRFYSRKLEVIRNGNTANFLITPSSGSFSFPSFNEKDFLIRIYNGDNPPLKIASIATSQEIRKLVAYMEGGEQYQLLMGDAKAGFPEYDLSAFADSIPATMPEIQVQTVQANIQAAVASKKESSVSLWLIIIGVLALLSFFTWTLTKELKKKPN